MYTDKINPDHPEGRLLILPTGFQLKDPSQPISTIPLHEKSPTMFKHLNGNNFEDQSKNRMRRAYDAICRSKAERNICRYNKLLKEMPKERKFIGLGGIMNWKDAVEFLLAGASAIQIGTANFIDPAITVKVSEGINDYLDRHGFTSVKDIIGVLSFLSIGFAVRPA